MGSTSSSHCSGSTDQLSTSGSENLTHSRLHQHHTGGKFTSRHSATSSNKVGSCQAKSYHRVPGKAEISRARGHPWLPAIVTSTRHPLQPVQLFEKPAGKTEKPANQPARSSRPKTCAIKLMSGIELRDYLLDKEDLEQAKSAKNREDRKWDSDSESEVLECFPPKRKSARDFVKNPYYNSMSSRKSSPARRRHSVARRSTDRHYSTDRSRGWEPKTLDHTLECPERGCEARYSGPLRYSKIDSHHKLHKQADSYSCAICNHIVPSKSSLGKHLDFSHGHRGLPDRYLEGQHINRTQPISVEEAQANQRAVKKFLKQELESKERNLKTTLVQLKIQSGLQDIRERLRKETERREKAEKVKKEEKEAESEEARRLHWRVEIQEKWKKDLERKEKERKEEEERSKPKPPTSAYPSLSAVKETQEKYPSFPASAPALPANQLQPQSLDWNHPCWRKAAAEEQKYLLEAKHHFWTHLYSNPVADPTPK